MIRIFLFTLFGYFSGSILYAHVFSKLLKKENILENSKDHNPGTANAFLYGGFWCGLFTLCCDVIKGFLPVYMYVSGISEIVFEGGIAFVLAAPVVGHIFPIFYKFQGGKGIAVTFGCLLGLLPDRLPVSILAFFFILFSVGVRITPHFYRTMAAYVCTVAAMFFLHVARAICVGFLIMTGAVCLRLHQSNEERERCRVKLLWMH